MSGFSERVAASLMSLDGEVAEGDEVLVGWFRGGEWVRADGVVVGSSSEFLIPDGEGGVAGG